MKFMSFNTQHCFSFLERKIDYSLMAETIRAFDPDFVGLNEMRGFGDLPGYEAQTEALSKLTGMERFYFGKAIDVQGKGPYGNAFLSKIPLLSVETVHIPDPSPEEIVRKIEHRCIIKAKLEGDITVLVTHFGLSVPEKKNAVVTVLEHLEDERCVLMGDLNMTPDDEILSPIFERMKDTAVAFPSPRFSYPSDRPTVKIDYIFASPDARILSADVPSVIASDHRPHLAQIEF